MLCHSVFIIRLIASLGKFDWLNLIFCATMLTANYLKYRSLTMLYEYAEKYTNTVGDRRKNVVILLKIKFQIISTNLSVRGFSAVVKISNQTQYLIK